ncbi:hypothetical protein A0H81_10630 [Grifola frondosa]|uniref:Uncharacterized protein n=1 Tax=Grifola frondosa TaxID=5627 RepID=A0A1C7LXD7_GRIFR|nr:hypothetical protein A0H81_10630 [Grifola frondosa]
MQTRNHEPLIVETLVEDYSELTIQEVPTVADVIREKGHGTFEEWDRSRTCWMRNLNVQWSESVVGGCNGAT